MIHSAGGEGRKKKRKEKNNCDMHLDYVGRLVGALFEDQHGRRVGVDVELLLQVDRLHQALVHVAKLQVVLVGEGGELKRHQAEVERSI